MEKKMLATLSVLLIFGVVFSDGNSTDDYLTSCELITSRNYNCETHEITTDDGYILTTFRVVNTRFSERSSRPVIMGHGVLASSADFLMNSAGGFSEESLNKTVGNNLGFEAAKLGYDVWLMNFRGNVYSKKHTTLESTDNKFWEFSFHEHAKYDLPAVIDYVLAMTSSQTVAYVGHSQGTAVMFILLSTQPKYNHLVKPFIAMAPVASTEFITNPFTHLANTPIIKVLEYKGGPFLTSGTLNQVATDLSNFPFSQLLERTILLLALGYISPQYDHDRTSVYLSHFPAGTSAKNLVHWAQMFKSRRFAMYDYGHAKNLEHYDQSSPPDYPLENITSTFILLMSAKNDTIATPLDVQNVIKRLQVPVKNYLVPFEPFNHIDFMIGKDTGAYVNPIVLQFLDSVCLNETHSN